MVRFNYIQKIHTSFCNILSKAYMCCIITFRVPTQFLFLFFLVVWSGIRGARYHLNEMQRTWSTRKTSIRWYAAMSRHIVWPSGNKRW